MRVKRFVALSIQEAMVQVKIEMGKEAVILHTRKFKEGGFLGLFSKEFVEVTAAVDQQYPELNRKDEERNKVIWPQVETKNSMETIEKKKSQLNIVEKIQEESSSENDESFSTAIELVDMKNLMEEMMIQIEHASLNVSFNKTGDKFYSALIKNEVEPKIARKIVKSIIDNLKPDQYDDNECIKDKFVEKIGRMLKKPRPIILPKRKQQQIFALVGPTGVGKTTTIAKLAANLAINNKKNLALITSDTYRIAAVEQLKAVGEVIGVPVEVVFTPQSIKNTIIEHRDKDVILIDTAGRSHKNKMNLSELKAFLDAAQPDEIFLVLSATTKLNDMLEIVKSYENIKYDKIIFTKLDETTTYGTILSMIYRTKKYLAYCTTGQSIPDDIEIADQKKLAGLILGDGGNNE